MTDQERINEFIADQPEPKRADMRELHGVILSVMPNCKLWFLDGKNEEGKVVSNPNIGYGSYTMKYTDGSTREFYQIGLTATTSGISVYIMGIEDRKVLPETYGTKLGKASVTGYCIRFKKLEDVDLDILTDAIRFGFEAQK